MTGRRALAAIVAVLALALTAAPTLAADPDPSAGPSSGPSSAPSAEPSPSPELTPAPSIGLLNGGDGDFTMHQDWSGQTPRPRMTLPPTDTAPAVPPPDTDWATALFYFALLAGALLFMVAMAVIAQLIFGPDEDLERPWFPDDERWP